VVMEETLSGALAALFKETAVGTVVAAQPPGVRTSTPLTGPAAERAREALNHYNQAMEQLKAGDWAGFGVELGALRRILEELSQPPSGR